MNKEDLFIQNLINIMKDGIPRLFTLELTITNKCNLNCLSCTARGKKKHNPLEEVSDKYWIQAVKTSINMNVKEITIIGGGEALTRPDLFYKLIIIIKKNNLWSDLTTNGTLFSEKLIKKMVELKYDNINFSLDAPDAKTNDYLRGKKGTFRKIVGNIKLFNFWKKKFNTGIPKINFNPVLSSKNYDKLDKMVLLAKKLGVFSIHVQPLQVRPKNEVGKMLTLTKDQAMEFRNHLKKVIEIAHLEKIENNFKQLIPEIIEKNYLLREINEEKIKKDKNKIFSYENNLLNISCFDPWTYMGIEIDGTIKSCYSRSTLFNIKRDNIKKVWSNKKYTAIRKKFLNGKKMNYCQNCCPTRVLDINTLKKRLCLNT